MRHLKQYHSPAQVLVEMTPGYPYTQAYLYRDDDYARAAHDRLMFCYPSLRKQPRLSENLWSTTTCDELVVITDNNGGVTVMTIMTRTVSALDSIVARIEKAEMQGERLENWYSPNQFSTTTMADISLVNDFAS